MLTADTTAADLLTYVVTHPEETDCRLVYADLLEERGEDARAELVRLQCELARWERLAIDRDSAPRAALRRRERDLLEAHFAAWTPRLPGEEGGYLLPSEPTVRVRLTGGQGDIALTFRRGFVEQITLTAAAFAGGPCGGERFVREPRPEPFEGPYVPGALREPTVRCPDCRGTGKTEGHAAALFAAAPILSVTLSDRRPRPNRAGDRFWWFDSGVSASPGEGDPALHRLPPGLMRLLPAEGFMAQGAYLAWRAATAQAALAALAASALLLGRRAAWPCESCAGTGRLNSHLAARARWPELPECPACAGTGHAVTVTPAPAAAP